jgi:hypothetical protein
MVEILQNGPKDGPIYLFAHGAGADMKSVFMTDVAERLGEKGLRVIRFNFPYMVKRAEDGKRRPPDRVPKLLAVLEQVVKTLDRPVVVGGKSMGGRISSLLLAENAKRAVSDQLSILGCACLGFPFHAPGKEPKDRLNHLQDLVEPLLIVQGTRDSMGNQEEVENYVIAGEINPEIELFWLPDGNHDLKPRKASGFSHQQHIDAAIEQVAEFVITRNS